MYIYIFAACPSIFPAKTTKTMDDTGYIQEYDGFKIVVKDAYTADTVRRLKRDERQDSN